MSAIEYKLDHGGRNLDLKDQTKEAYNDRQTSFDCENPLHGKGKAQRLSF